MVDVGDEVFAITAGGGVIRTRAAEVRPTSRATMGVRLINLDDGNAVVGVTRNPESSDEDEADDSEDVESAGGQGGDDDSIDLPDHGSGTAGGTESGGLPDSESPAIHNETEAPGIVAGSDDAADTDRADPDGPA